MAGATGEQVSEFDGGDYERHDSLAAMMAVVAVIAINCFMLAMTDGGGVLLILMALNVGLVRWWRGRGRGRRFWLGFEVAGLVAVLAYIGLMQTNNELIVQWPVFLLNHAPYMNGFWNSLAINMSQIAGLLLFEVSYGFPMLLIAVLGGLFTSLRRSQT